MERKREGRRERERERERERVRGLMLKFSPQTMFHATRLIPRAKNLLMVPISQLRER